jgi:hypothetical protein
MLSRTPPLMAKVTLKITHVAWRDGRPRYNPGPKHRKLGLKGEDLRHPDGRWFTAEEAMRWSSQVLQPRIEEIRRAKAEGKRKPRAKAPGVYTVEDMFEYLWRSPKFTGGRGGAAGRRVLAERTVHDYRLKARSLMDYDPVLAGSDIRALTKPILIGLFERLWQDKGHHMAHGIMAVLRLALTHAERHGRIPANPARGLGLETPAERLRVGSLEEMQRLIRTADAIGETMIGHAIMLGLMTGQRQGDRLSLQDAGHDEGVRRFRQAKTGAIVEIPETPQLTQRLAQARKERETWGVKVAEIIVDQRSRRRFTTFSYGKRFARVRAAAIAGVRGEDGKWIVEPTPSLDGFRDQDLRDTAVTWLARAGCSIPEIRSITGHDEQSIYKILKHYLAVDAEMARHAVGKLVGYLEDKGVAL